MRKKEPIRLIKVDGDTKSITMLAHPDMSTFEELTKWMGSPECQLVSGTYQVVREAGEVTIRDVISRKVFHAK